MKIEDVGYIPFASIFDQQKPVVDLLERLKSGDVLINPLDCEKDIEYTCLRQLRESRVPLMLQLEKLARVKSFLLRNESLEVELSDYTKIISSGIPGMIGSRIGGRGVKYNLSFDGHRGREGIFENARRILTEFYNPLGETFTG